VTTVKITLLAEFVLFVVDLELLEVWPLWCEGLCTLGQVRTHTMVVGLFGMTTEASMGHLSLSRVLDCLDSMFCMPITLWVTRAAGYMCKVV